MNISVIRKNYKKWITNFDNYIEIRAMKVDNIIIKVNSVSVSNLNFLAFERYAVPLEISMPVRT